MIDQTNLCSKNNNQSYLLLLFKTRLVILIVYYSVKPISHTGVTVSFFSAELYCSSERKGSPLGNVSSGDLVAISQTPSCHSSGHRPEDFNRNKS